MIIAVTYGNQDMPLDPFADDPNDPASLLEPDDYQDDVPPLSSEDIEALRQDLTNVRDFRRLLEPRGIRGIAMLCDDCEETHFYDWGIIESNINTMLNHEAVPVHEPGAQPNPEHYVSWDYCLGYAEAVDFVLGGAQPRFPWRF